MDKTKGISRRRFLKALGALGTSSLVAVSDLSIAAPEGPSGNTGDPAQVVPRRPFGKTGVQVSCLALGGMFDIPSNQLLMRQALKWGVSYWDTADCYEGGKSEIGIGQFFGKYPEARKEVFLVTKSDARDPEGMTRLLHRSLDRMKTDYVDCYFIHGMKKMEEINQETRTWVEKAKAEGKIRFFGFSTHSNMEDLLLGAARLGWVDGIMASYNFRLMHTDKMKAAVDACVKAGIGLTAMKTQGGGPVGTESEIELRMAGRFLKQGFTDKQAKLKAVWDNPHIAGICSQMPNLTILSANVAAALDQTRLSSADMDLLRIYARETTSSYCAGCSDLCESCVGNQVPIQDVMRCLMYYRSHGDKDLARHLFAELPAHTRRSLLTLDFTEAEQRCPQKIRIGKLMREAVSLLA